MEAVAIVALVVASVSLVLSIVAYWRSGGAADISALREELRREAEAFRQKQRALADDLASKARSGYTDSLDRIQRAQQRLAEIRRGVSADLHEGVDHLARQLAERKREVEAELERLKHEVSADIQEKQEAMARRVRHLEGRVQMLRARHEIARAERLAEKQQFAAAEDLLEDAVADVRRIRATLSDEGEEDPAFADVIAALHDALRAVRARAEDMRRQIDHVLSASDTLLSSLEAREQRAA